MIRGLDCGYLLVPTKSIFVILREEIQQDQTFSWGVGVQMVTCGRYLGGFIGDGEAQESCIGDKVCGQEEVVQTLVGV